MGIPLLVAPAVPAAHAKLSGPANVANARQIYHAPGRPWGPPLRGLTKPPIRL